LKSKVKASKLDVLYQFEQFVDRFVPSLEGSFLLITYQYGMMAITLLSIFAWIVLGFDSTVHYFLFEHGFGEAPIGFLQAPGIGIHWSTLLTIAFAALNLSFYLKKNLKVDGIINIAYSLIIGWWVSMMVFEIPYVFAQDIFHNNGIEFWFFPIWRSGYKTMYLDAGATAGREALRWLLIALVLFPLEVTSGYIGYIVPKLPNIVQRMGAKRAKNFSYMSMFVVWLVVLLGVWTAFARYQYPIIIRNFSWFFGFMFTHCLLVYEFTRPTRRNNPQSFHYRFKNRFSVALILIQVVLWAIWIFYPYTPLQTIYPAVYPKGSLFPQTVYAWYSDIAPIIISQGWYENFGVHLINVSLKFVSTLWTCYVFAPVIISKGKGSG